MQAVAEHRDAHDAARWTAHDGFCDVHDLGTSCVAPKDLIAIKSIHHVALHRSLFVIALRVERGVPIEAKLDHSIAARHRVSRKEGVAGVGLAAERPPRSSHEIALRLLRRLRVKTLSPSSKR